MNEVKALPAGTVCRLSQYHMLTPWDCVRSLVDNSLASGAANVAVRVDLDNTELRVQVLDDGSGVLPSDMNVIGRQNWTGQDSEKGSSLSELRKVSRCVKISSKYGEATTMLAEFEKGLRKQVKREHAERKCPGTTVTVSGYLWNVKVRRKLVRETSSLAVIKRGLFCYSVLHQDVRFSLRNDTYCKKDLVFNSPRHSNSLEAFTSLLPDNLKGTFTELTWQRKVEGSRITGYLYSESHHNNLLQLLCVNQKPFLQSGDLQRHVTAKLKKLEMLKEKRIQHPIYVFFIEVPVVLVEEIQKMFNCLFGESDSETDFFRKPSADDTMLGIKPLESSADVCVRKDDITAPHFSSIPINGARFSIPVKTPPPVTEKKRDELEDLSSWVNPNFSVHVSKFPLKLSLEREARRSGLGLKIKLTKQVMRSTRLIGQADDKFICSVSGNYLLLWDQHAVHERINLEFMINSAKLPDGKLRPRTLSSPVTVEMRTDEEVKALADSSEWGIHFAVLEDERTLLVTDVPFTESNPSLQVQLVVQLLQDMAAFKLNGQVYILPRNRISSFSNFWNLAFIQKPHSQ